MVLGCALLVWCCTWVVAAARCGARARMVYGMHALAPTSFAVVAHDFRDVYTANDASSHVLALSMYLLLLSVAADNC